MRTHTLVLPLASLLAIVLSDAGDSHAASKDEEGLRTGCTWLDRALTREPDRDDAFGMFMRGLMPKCQALLEGLARGDKSVRPEGLKAVVNEIEELRSVIDAEHGAPPPATGKPTPDELAKKKVADEKAGIDSEAQKKAEAERQAAEEARRIEDEKKAAEAEAKRKADEAKAAAEAERRLAEQRARETDKERKAREAEEKKAEAARLREEEKARKEEAERVKQEARARELEEKKAAEELKREEAARLSAEKKAADEARKQAEKQAREERLAEDEAKRLIEEAEREAVAEQARLAREKAAELVAEELAAGDEEARLERQRLAEENARRQAEERALKEAQKETPKETRTRSKGGAFDGTWEQPASKELDRNIKRTLNIFTKDGKIQGEVVEEVWYPAPTSWVDRSCEGNNTFRMVTSARVSGEAGKTKLVLWRDIPRVLTCTCPSRCTVETRRRGFDLAASPDGRELSDSSGVFVRPGTVIVGSAKQAAGEAMTGAVVAATPKSFAGTWETPAFKRRDETVVRRLELKLVGDKLRGTLVEKSSQKLPLSSWSERFCAGANRWEWVASWEIEGDVKGTSISLKGQGGDNLTCSCPSKCKKPKEKLSMGGSLGASGKSITIDGDLYEKK